MNGHGHKHRLEENVPRIHVHVYEVKRKMYEIEFTSDEVGVVEARELAIEYVKRGANVNPPVKSDSKFIAVSFLLTAEHKEEPQ